MKLKALIHKLQSDTLTSQAKGSLFERIVRFYLEHDAIQKDQFKQVAFYRNFIGNYRLNQPLDLLEEDLRIDLIATRNDDTLCDVQCKHRMPTVRITKTMIESFYAELSRIKRSKSYQ